MIGSIVIQQVAAISAVDVSVVFQVFKLPDSFSG